MSARSSLPSRTITTNKDTVVILTEVLEVMSPQASLEIMGPTTVQDLPRYHSLVKDFEGFANQWRAAGHLRGPANTGVGYLLDLTTPLPSEKGGVLLGELD